jgi:hypothetical protein
VRGGSTGAVRGQCRSERERRQRGDRLRLARGGARVGDGVCRALTRVNGRGAEVLE